MFNNARDVVTVMVACVLLMNGCGTYKNIREETRLDEEIKNKLAEIERESGPDIVSALNRVSWALFTENVDSCRTGMKKDFGYSAQASEINPEIQFIIHVVKGSPAWNSGLKKGDKVISSQDINNSQRLLKIKRKNHAYERVINATWICDMDIYYMQSDDVYGYSENKGIVVTSSLVGMAENNSELAAIIAHEWAHSMDPECHHVRSGYLPAVVSGGRGIKIAWDLLAKASVLTGLISFVKSLGNENNVERQGELTEKHKPELIKLDCEVRADVLSLELMKKAGFEPGAAVNLLNKLSKLVKSTGNVEISNTLNRRVRALSKIVNNAWRVH